MTTFGAPPAAKPALRVNGQSPLGWALRRALLGLAILAVSIGGAAWLLYAAIDPDVEAGAEARAALRKSTILEEPDTRAAVTTTGSVPR